MLIAAISGLIAGAIHVLSGPDHVAAIAPLSVQQRRAGWRIGFQWGAGHSLSVLAIGALAFWLRHQLPVHALSSWAERVVGITLIAIGLWGLRKALQNRVHVHEHAHGEERHSHAHFHSSPQAHSQIDERPHTHTHAAFAIGTLHGLAGSSHLLGILPALALPDATHAVAYLVAFAAGTVAGMTGFSSLISCMAVASMRRKPQAYRALMSTCSVIAVGIGGYWLIL